MFICSARRFPPEISRVAAMASPFPELVESRKRCRIADERVPTNLVNCLKNYLLLGNPCLAGV